jgi:hypothetical protein
MNGRVAFIVAIVVPVLVLWAVIVTFGLCLGLSFLVKLILVGIN